MKRTVAILMVVFMVILTITTTVLAGQKRVCALQYVAGTDQWIDGSKQNFNVGNEVGAHIVGMSAGNYALYFYREYERIIFGGTIYVGSKDFYTKIGYTLTEADAGKKFILVVGSYAENGFILRDQFQVKPISLQKSTIVPKEFSLSAFPNPFNPATTIAYALTENVDQLKITIFDLRGCEVVKLHDGFQKAGNHALQWNANYLPSGRYFCRFEDGVKARILPLTLLK